jgi:NADPH-dependent 2,4-dienoyl-CoA reductase/sulfur reductase-like enzyme
MAGYRLWRSFTQAPRPKPRLNLSWIVGVRVLSILRSLSLFTMSWAPTVFCPHSSSQVSRSFWSCLCTYFTTARSAKVPCLCDNCGLERFAMASSSQPRRIAVIGSGIAGLSAAYHLAKHGQNVQVEVFEKESCIGGHEMPLETQFGTIDLGFMVRNGTRASSCKTHVLTC